MKNSVFCNGVVDIFKVFLFLSEPQYIPNMQHKLVFYNEAVIVFHVFCCSLFLGRKFPCKAGLASPRQTGFTRIYSPTKQNNKNKTMSTDSL